jgi:ribonuclease Z
MPSERYDFEDFFIESFRVDHNVLCYGYTFNVERIGKFDVDKALALQIEKKHWKVLQNGSNVKTENGTFTPSMVLGPPRKGLKLTYCTDTRPQKVISDFAVDSDLFICEGMYAEEDKQEKAIENKHMTFKEAAQLARNANVKELWLTHYSPSLTYPKQYISSAKDIFENTVAAYDGISTELKFGDE